MSKISVTPGSGEDVTTDTVSAQKVQVVKIMHGATTVDGGLVATGNPLPVVQTGTHNIGTVTTVTTVAAITAVGTVTPGTAASSLGKAEDAAHASGDVGVMALGVQKATPADLGADGDYSPFQMDSGQMWVKLGTALPAGTAAIGKLAANSGVDIGDVDVTSLPALVAGTALIGKVGIDQTTPGTTNAVVISPGGYTASATFTPAANSHVANDCNGAAGTFASMGPSAGRVIINSASLEIDGGTAEATAWRLYLYNVTPPSATADDGAWDLPSGDRASFLGYVDLGTAVDLGSTQYVEQNGIGKQVKLSGTSLFGYLVNLTTLTPANVAHIVTLHAVPV